MSDAQWLERGRNVVVKDVQCHLIVVGVVLVGLVLWFPKGLMGTIREKWLTWLP